MKELLVLRHAKSSWKTAGLDDHDRPLNKRGERDAPRMGALIRAEGIVPERIVSSTAVRARTTAATVALACGFTDAPYATDELYLSGVRAYAAIAATHGCNCHRVMLVGHNPDVEDLVQALTEEDETMPTAALARVEVDIEHWADLTLQSKGKLLGIWRPRELD